MTNMHIGERTPPWRHIEGRDCLNAPEPCIHLGVSGNKSSRRLADDDGPVAMKMRRISTLITWAKFVGFWRAWTLRFRAPYACSKETCRDREQGEE